MIDTTHGTQIESDDQVEPAEPNRVRGTDRRVRPKLNSITLARKGELRWKARNWS